MQYTSHIRLPLFESADKPTWLYDWNETMVKLDDVIYQINSSDIPAELAELVSRVNALEVTVAQHTTDISELQDQATSILSDIEHIMSIIPSSASPTNKLATMADIVGVSGDTFNPDDFNVYNNVVSLQDGRRIVVLTGAQYDALSEQQKMNGQTYFIKDRNPGQQSNSMISQSAASFYRTGTSDSNGDITISNVPFLPQTDIEVSDKLILICAVLSIGEHTRDVIQIPAIIAHPYIFGHAFNYIDVPFIHKQGNTDVSGYMRILLGTVLHEDGELIVHGYPTNTEVNFSVRTFVMSPFSLS